MIKAKSVILDPTGIYPITKDYIVITTEVEWLKLFGQDSNACYQVQGEFLCRWTREWLRIWEKTDLIIEEKQKPAVFLQSLFPGLVIPSQWSDEQVLAIATHLETYPKDNALGHFLAEITQCDCWLKTPSWEHLYQWLAISLPEEYQPFEQLWLIQNQAQFQDLSPYYQTQDKILLLRRWIGLAPPAVENVPVYPLDIPSFLQDEFKQFWRNQIISSEGKILAKIEPRKQAGMNAIANCAYQVLRQKTSWVTSEIISKLKPFLKGEKINELNQLKPPYCPEMLELNSATEKVFEWVTKAYLPYRRWEVLNNTSPNSDRKSDQQAASFVEWIAYHYPQLKLDSTDSSALNYNVTAQVLELCQTNPVFWVVVDGLGWLDHLELLSILAETSEFGLETELQPRFSILPTTAEYGNNGFYSQRSPCDPHWVDNAVKGFCFINIGECYSDGKKQQLLSDLKANKHQLYCWNTQELYKLYHEEKDFESFYHTKRSTVLNGIANSIKYYAQQYPNPEKLKIVIAGDRGQIMGNSEAEVRGTHGGLFPEEVVVGFSVLFQVTQRLPVQISCQGKVLGNKPGELQLNINNPNSVSLSDLWLYIEQIEEYKNGQLLNIEVPAKQTVAYNLKFSQLSPSYKSLKATYKISLTGRLDFCFALSSEIVSSCLSADSAINVEQIFSSEMNIDDLL